MQKVFPKVFVICVFVFFSVQKFEIRQAGYTFFNILKIKSFGKFMVGEILTCEDKHFRNATYNNIEKLCRQIIGVISKSFSELVEISLPINLIRFVRIGIKII